MNFTLILTPLIMIGFYILIFSFYSEIILIIFAFILGILAGVMNNGTHFMISYPFPKIVDFSNYHDFCKKWDRKNEIKILNFYLT